MQEKTNAKDITSYEAYISEINKIPVLTPEEELDLARKIRNGDKAAEKKFIAANLRLVVSIAFKFQKRGSLMDIIQNGNLGLIKAVGRFDPELGYKFSTYATNWIMQAIQRGLVNEENTVKIPLHLFITAEKARNAQNKLSQKNPSEPTFEEIANEIGEKKEKVEKAMNVTQHSLSLNTQENAEYDNSSIEATLEDNSNNPVEIQERQALKSNLREALMSLTPREREIIMMRYDLDGKGIRNLVEISKKFGISKERARQIEAAAIRKMQKPQFANKLKEFVK